MQELFDMCKGITLLGMQQAVSPHFLEVTRQHVVEEAADELCSAGTVAVSVVLALALR